MFQAGALFEYINVEYSDRTSVLLLVSRAELLVDRDSWRHSYLAVKREILGFVQGGLLRCTTNNIGTQSVDAKNMLKLFGFYAA